MPRATRRLLLIRIAMMAWLIAGCAAPPTVSLEQAINDNTVSASFVNDGTYGDIMLIKLSLTGKEAVTIDIPRGTLLQNSNDERESFVVYKYKGKVESESSNRYQQASSVVLSTSGREHLGMIEAYSINALSESPESSDTFAVEGIVKDETKAVLDAIPADASIEIRQIAVWVTTDDISKADLDLLSIKYSDADVQQVKDIVEKAKLDADDYKLFTE